MPSHKGMGIFMYIYNIIMNKLKIDIEAAQRFLSSLVTQDILALASAYENAGHQLFMVGGCVRDALLNLTPKDIDFCTDATPDQSMAIIRAMEGITKVDLHGEHFAVVVMHTLEHPEGIEIASFREDLTEGRHPEVKIGVTIEQDVLRRDFTINAMYFNVATSKIIDLVGGISDLENMLVKAVGNAVDRFREDPLRKLRCLRFATRFDFHIEDATWAAIMADPSLDISRNRIYNEFKTTYDKAQDLYILMFNIESSGLIYEIFKGYGISYIVPNNIEDSVGTFHLFLAHILEQIPATTLNLLVQDYAFSASVVKGVQLLKRVKAGELNAKEISKFWSARKSCHVTDSEILIYTSNSNEIKALLAIEFDSTLSQSLMDQGIQGPSLGKAINQHYYDLYKLKLKEISGSI